LDPQKKSNNHKEKIYLYHFFLDHRLGGQHAYTKTIINEILKYQVFTYKIITTKKGELTDIPLINLRHFWFGLYPIEVIINTILILVFVFHSKIKRHNSIFHIHGAANIAPVFAASFLKIPIVWHFHETVSTFLPLVKAGKYFLTRTKHRLVTVTEKAIEVYQLNEADIISSPVDSNYWRHPFKNSSSYLNNNVFKIVCTANLNPLKGQDVLLKSIFDFKGKWELLLIGAKLKTHRKYYHSLIKTAIEVQRINPDCKIHFLDWQTKEQIRNYLEKCDVFILPSRSEACPIALLEAMSMGKICIASNVGGVSKIISDPSKGFLINSEEPNEILEALHNVQNLSIKKRNIIGTNARSHIKKNYSQLSISKKFIKLYCDLSK
jgi:glycosyltransferase involved in cell wall biosynthesis